jgi:hypothetical protein
MAGPLAEVSRMPGLLVVRLADAGVAQLEQASVATLEALRLSSAYRMVLMKKSHHSARRLGKTYCLRTKFLTGSILS